MIQKLEADIRNHIRIEQQLKLHIESIQNKLEELERSKENVVVQNPDAKVVEELELIQREKRRMDELISVKESQILKLQESLEQGGRKFRKLEEQFLGQKKQLEEKMKSTE